MNLLINISTLYTCRADGAQSELHAISDAAVIWDNDTIAWVGSATEIPTEYDINKTFNAEGRIVLPGLVDCHTHLAFGGWRSDEFELRSLGKPYVEIAKAGGGILSTMKHTREASENDLLQKAKQKLRELTELGITTIECKSGYGLTTEDELKILRVYQKLQESEPNRMKTTFLGAHTVPPEFKENRQDYITLVCDEMIPKVASENLATFCDVFADDAAFSIEEARQVLQAGLRHGLIPKIHADQLSSTGGAELAVEVGAASADHLEQISDEGIKLMADSDTVAVSIPLASFYLRQAPIPARKLIEAGIPVAVSTDYNPGSAPSHHLPMAMMMACTLQYMSPAEVVKGATIYAAKALLMDLEVGSVETGKKADFIEIDAESVNSWLYHFRANACKRVYLNGEMIHEQ